jgi:hypothetical protein
VGTSGVLVDFGTDTIDGPPAFPCLSSRATATGGYRLAATIGRRNPLLSTGFGTAVASRAGPSPNCKNDQSRVPIIGYKRSRERTSLLRRHSW